MKQHDSNKIMVSDALLAGIEYLATGLQAASSLSLRSQSRQSAPNAASAGADYLVNAMTVQPAVQARARPRDRSDALAGYRRWFKGNIGLGVPG